MYFKFFKYEYEYEFQFQTYLFNLRTFHFRVRHTKSDTPAGEVPEPYMFPFRGLLSQRR